MAEKSKAAWMKPGQRIVTLSARDSQNSSAPLTTTLSRRTPNNSSTGKRRSPESSSSLAQILRPADPDRELGNAEVVGSLRRDNRASMRLGEPIRITSGANGGSTLRLLEYDLLPK